MSSHVDNRIVEMEFNNKDFEKGVSQTLQSLDKLNDNLNNLGSDVNKGHSGLSDMLGGVADKLDDIKDHFSGFEYFVQGIFKRLGERVIDFGIDLTKSLTIDNIAAGMEQYENTIKNVGAMLNQIEGISIDEIENYLDKLTWYADSTSYSMSAMTTALKSFTNNGVEIEDATDIIMGLGNSFSYAGATATEMAGAFTVYAQVLSQGYMDLRRFRQLNETYNVMGYKTREQYMEAAYEMGELIKEEGKFFTLYEDGTKGEEVNVSTFANTLTEWKWLTSDVIKHLMTEYGNYSSAVYAFKIEQEELTNTVLTTAEAMALYDDYAKENNIAVSELGRAALQAAMEAKTFSEVIDALKDASKSKFATIFQSILGNYEEARDLFTELGDYLSGVFIDPLDKVASTFAKWKSEVWRISGGRGALIDAFKNLAKAMELVAEPFHTLARGVFPEFSTSLIANGVRSFHNFTDSVVKVAETINKVLMPVAEALTHGFKGVFDLLKLIGRSVEQIFRAMKPVFDAIGNFASNQVGALDTLLKKFEGFAAGLKVSERALSAISAVSDAGAAIIEAMIPAFETLKKTIVGVYNSVKPAIDILVDCVIWLGNSTRTIIELISRLQLLEKLSTYVTNKFWELKTKLTLLNEEFKTGKSILNAVGESLKTVQGIGKTFANVIIVAFGSIQKAITGLGSGFFQRISEWNKTVEASLTEMTDSVQSKIAVVKTAIENLKKIIKPVIDEIIKYAKMAAGGLGVAFNDMFGPKSAYEKARNSISGRGSGILGFLDELITFISRLSFAKLNLGLSSFFSGTGKFMKNAGKFLKKDDILTKLGEIFNTIMHPFETLAKGSVDNVSKSIDLVGNSLKTFQTDLKADALKRLAVAIALIAGSIFVLSLIPQDKLKPSVEAAGMIAGAIGALMIVMTRFAKATSDWKTLAASSVAILSIAASLILVATAMSILATIPNLNEAVGATMMLMGMLTAMLAVMGILNGRTDAAAFKGSKDTATMIAKIGTAMVALAGVVKILGDMPPENLKQGMSALALLLTMVLLIGVVFIAINALGKEFDTKNTTENLVGIGAALIMAAMAMTIFAAAVFLLGSMKPETAAQGILAMGVILAAVTIALKKTADPKVLAGAAGMMIIAAAMIVFTAALLALGLVPFEFLAGALGKFLLVILSLAGAAFVMKFVSGSMIEFGKGMIMTGAGLMLIVGAISLFTLALIGLSTLSPVAVGAIIVALDMLLKGAMLLLDDLARLVVAAIAAFIVAIADSIGVIVDAIVELCLAIADALEPYVGPILDKFWNWVKGLLASLLRKLNLWWIECKAEWRATFVSLETKAKQAVDNVIQAMKDAIDGAIESIKTSAKNLMNGIIQGITGKRGEVDNAMEDTAESMNETFEKKEKINSPSKVFSRYGMYIDQGLANGLRKYATLSSSAAEDVGDGTMDAMAEVLSTLPDLLQEDMDLSPTITPVMDLSEIQNGSRSIDDIFNNGRYGVGFGSKALQSMGSVFSRGDSASEASGKTTTITYTQNNYSPKALSRIDIYRQTKNQISTIKGVITSND